MEIDPSFYNKMTVKTLSVALKSSYYNIILHSLL